MEQSSPQAARVLVVDDSFFARSVIRDALEEYGNFEVTETASDGEEALELIRENLAFDAITLDINMPNLNGLQTLSRLQSMNVEIPVLVLSSLTKEDARASMKALDRGAADVMAKPQDELTGDESSFGPKLRRRLQALIESAGEGPAKNPRPDRVARPEESVDVEPIRSLLIGGSTGAPPVVREILANLPENCPIPVMVVQHIEEPFLSSFQQNIREESNLKVEEIQNRMDPRPGTVYFAPEGHHLEINQWGDEYQIRSREDTPVNNALPSVEILFQSAARTYGAQCMAYLLTGLGEDGAEGMKSLHDRGAYCVVQDRESSVVHGMAGSALEKDAVDRQVSADKFPEFTRNFIQEHSAKSPLKP